MLRNPNGTFSLSKCVFGMAWIVSIAVVGKYLTTDLTHGADVAAAVGAILTPAGAVYTWRAHSQGTNANDPACRDV